uniref:Uncharacterized protein n=1 Tax=Melicertus latisulcatus pemonivirus TaxID=2984278 RepID=A0A9C7BQH3_9VIRU|nr:MAG: hypothetical protein [Melicertus latisulcatus pemonivirus]
MSVANPAPLVVVKPVGEGATLCFGTSETLPTAYSGNPAARTLAVNVFEVTVTPRPSRDAPHTHPLIKEMFAYKLSDDCYRLMRPHRKFMLDTRSTGGIWDFVSLV